MYIYIYISTWSLYNYIYIYKYYISISGWWLRFHKGTCFAVILLVGLSPKRKKTRLVVEVYLPLKILHWLVVSCGFNPSDKY